MCCVKLPVGIGLIVDCFFRCVDDWKINRSGSFPCTVVMVLIRAWAWRTTCRGDLTALLIHSIDQQFLSNIISISAQLVNTSNPKTPICLNQFIIHLYSTRIDRFKTNVWACRWVNWFSFAAQSHVPDRQSYKLNNFTYAATRRQSRRDEDGERKTQYAMRKKRCER